MDPAALALAIPPAAVALRDLIQDRLRGRDRKDFERLFRVLIEKVTRYADEHRYLQDWKLIHEGVHTLQKSLTNQDHLASVLNPPSTKVDFDIEGITKSWKVYLELYLRPFYDKRNDLKKLQDIEIVFYSERMDPVTREHPKVELFSCLTEFGEQITEAIGQRVDGLSKTIRHLGRLKSFLDDALTTADGEIRRMAGSLADSSSRLEESLQTLLS